MVIQPWYGGNNPNLCWFQSHGCSTEYALVSYNSLTFKTGLETLIEVIWSDIHIYIYMYIYNYNTYIYIIHIKLYICIHIIHTWWLIPLSKWVINPVISGLTLLIPFITGVITHLLSGMSHQVLCRYIYIYIYKKPTSWFISPQGYQVSRLHQLGIDGFGISQPRRLRNQRWLISNEKKRGKSPFLMGKSTINGHFQ